MHSRAKIAADQCKQYCETTRKLLSDTAFSNLALNGIVCAEVLLRNYFTSVTLNNSRAGSLQRASSFTCALVDVQCLKTSLFLDIIAIQH